MTRRATEFEAVHERFEDVDRSIKGLDDKMDLGFEGVHKRLDRFDVLDEKLNRLLEASDADRS